jgi:uncharacterized protein DUF2550
VGAALDDIIWLLVAVLLLLALAAAVIAVRRFLLERGGGTIECGLRVPADTGGWRPGVASYHRDELYWYRALGILLRPRRMFTRRSLGVISRRPAEPAEARVLGPGRVVVQLDTDSAGQVELAMTPEALTGFLAWLEASPPSSHLGDIALTPGYPERIVAPPPFPLYTAAATGRSAEPDGASGARPAIRSAARSAMAITGAFVLPRGTDGMTEASTTRRPSMPRTFR